MESLAARAHVTAHLAQELLVQHRLVRSRSLLERAQRRRLRRVIHSAYETVPYYRETMRRHGLGPQDVRTAADLAKLPIIEREDVQRDPEYFLSRSRPPAEHLMLQSSGGASGTPKIIFHDVMTLAESGAHAERHRLIVRRLAGTRFAQHREAIIESPFGATRIAQDFLARRLLVAPARIMPRLYLSLIDPPDQIAGLLSRFRPHVIDGYGSYLDLLMPYIQANVSRDAWPNVVVYNSDAMTGTTRRLITRDMGIPVLSVYGAVEALHIGFECERGLGYHVNFDLCPLRIIRPDGAEGPLGENGDVIISNLVNRATVLLNYRLGDIAHLLRSACPCGRQLPLLSFIEGRGDDWISGPSGETLHPQAIRTLFSDELSIYQYQVTQTADGGFEIDVVAKQGADHAEMRDRLIRKFERRLGAGARVRVSFLDALPRTPGGKVRAILRTTK